MFAGKPPTFEEGGLAGVRLKFYRRRLSRPNHPELPDHTWQVIEGCLKKTPSQRKTIAEVVISLKAELGLY